MKLQRNNALGINIDLKINHGLSSHKKVILFGGANETLPKAKHQGTTVCVDCEDSLCTFPASLSSTFFHKT
jgi:hypothetical protein